MSKNTRDRGRLLGFGAAGLACVGLVAIVSGFWTSASSGRQGAILPTVVTVTAGKPTEFAFKLSKSSALPWNAAARSSKVTFKVGNKGALPHAFKVCTDSLEGALANTCRGKGTKTLKPGQSASLTITFTTRGTYEYLSTVSGQAAKGMKGVIGIGVPVTKTTTPKTTTTTPKTTTTPSTTPPSTTPPPPTTPSTPSSPTPAPTGGDAAAGAAVWVSAGCVTCHSFGEVKGNVLPNLNVTHPGAFDNGPLTATQIRDLVAYVDSR